MRVGETVNQHTRVVEVLESVKTQQNKSRQEWSFEPEEAKQILRAKISADSSALLLRRRVYSLIIWTVWTSFNVDASKKDKNHFNELCLTHQNHFYDQNSPLVRERGLV